MSSRGSGRDADTQLTDAGIATDQTVEHDPSNPPASRPSGQRIRPTPRPHGTLGRYTIVRELGRGGMGTVFEADDPMLGRRVAIKVLREDLSDPRLSEGLRHEAQALARLVHPNVVAVHDVGVDFDGMFIVMQLVAGRPIDIALRGRSQREIIGAFRDAGRGLAAAHEAGLVHCDFKPSNVLVDRDGTVRVTDFGIARLATDGASGAIAGTPAYMAPEQFTGLATPSSDQYAFCVSLYEVLVGAMPYDTTTEPRTVRPVPRNAGVPAYVVRALMRGLATEPSQRFPSMNALLVALAPPRWRQWAVIGAVAAVALAGVSIGSARLTRHTAVAPPADAPVWGDPDLAAQRTLTSYGAAACAYAPTLEADAVVFDRTQGDAVDLYELPLAGGSARQLTSEPTWEWRSHPGKRPGEVLFLVTDMKHYGTGKIVQLDRATGQQTTVEAAAAVDSGQTSRGVIYVSLGGKELRLVDAGHDAVLARPPAGYEFSQVAVSRRGDRIAVVTNRGTEVELCLVDVTSGAVDCAHDQVLTGRPAFGVDDHDLYYGTRDGIRRRTLATGENTLVLPDAIASGGITISADGRALVYSNCGTYSRLIDWTETPPKVLVNDARAAMPSATSTSRVIWIRNVRGEAVLAALTEGGRQLQLTDGAFGRVAEPAVSPHGDKVAFRSTGAHTGLFTMDLAMPPMPQQVTDNATDARPIWIGRETLAFTRHDEGAVATLYAVPSIGGTPRRLSTSSRVGIGSRGNEILVVASGQLLWLDVTSGKERPGPSTSFVSTRIDVSPNGRWIVFGSGQEGQSLSRMSFDRPGEPEPLPHAATGQTIAGQAITDDGHVILALATWSGDLYLVPARPGTRF